MNARKRSSPLGSKHRKRLGIVCLAIACALIAVGLYAWQSKPVAETGASVTAAEGKSRQEIQDELDAIVRDNMMTISSHRSPSYKKAVSCASTYKTSRITSFPSVSA